jgi:hypothetical protein
MKQQRNQTNNNIVENKNPVTSPNENYSHTVVTTLNGSAASPNK